MQVTELVDVLDLGSAIPKEPVRRESSSLSFRTILN